MLNQNQTTTANEYLTQATAAASVAIRGKHEKSASPKLTAMQNSRHRDEVTEATADQMNEAGTLRAEAYKAIHGEEGAKVLRAYANQSGRTPAEVQAARAKAEQLETKAAKLIKEAATIEAAAMEDKNNPNDKSRTFSDFQPIKHDAIVGRLTAEQMPYVVSPSDMDRAAARLAEAVKEHRPGTPWEAMNAARSAAAMVEANPAILFDAAYSAFIFRAATNAANKAITANLHHDSHNRTTERKTIATDEIMTAWRAAHGNNSGKGYKVYTGRDTANWYTMEYRTYKKEPSGWYLVHHHKTIAPTVSIEAFTDESHGNEAELVSNGGIPMVETQEARERLEVILDTSNFTEREREFTRYFLSPKAAQKGQAAVNEALATKARARRAKAEAKAAKHTATVQKTKQAQEAAEAAKRAAKAAQVEADKVPNDIELIRYRGMTEAAAAHIGINTRSQLDNFTSRWRARAAEAVKMEQGCTTPEEAAEAEAKQWERMQKNSTRGRNNAEAVQVLFVGIDSTEAITKAAPGAIKAVQRAAKKAEERGKADKAKELRAKAERIKAATRATEATKADPVITWNESGITPQTMTPEEVETMTARERAAEAARLNQYGENIAFIEYRRRLRYEAARTPWKALNATAAAMVFLDHMTAEEQAEVMKARRAERAADSARLRAEAEEATKTHHDTWNSRKGYQITAKAWNSLEAAQRLAMLDRIHVEGMKLDFITA